MATGKIKIYTGIGFRDTPLEVMTKIEEVGFEMADKGWTLRSGGAPGAEHAFEIGCDMALGTKEIYLPWQGFNGKTSEHHEPSLAAYEIASRYHNHWANVRSDSVRRIHATRVHLVLGADLNDPSDLIICWSPNGQVMGDVALALRLAIQYNIPVKNLGAEVKDRESIDLY